MGFWGIEVKPGKPYTHLFDSALGRLRISQGTLGNGKSTERSLLQCNVGKKSPILLCSLIPNVLETCHLELEFSENEEVIFSVLGKRSVHLSGYFLGHGRSIGGDESDSYGEDIAASDADNSVSFDSFESEDEYESDFIDDADLGMFPHSSQRKIIIEEIVEDEKPANENASRRRLKKKYSASDPDNGNIEPESQLLIKGSDSKVVESEDEDGFPISFSLRKKNAGKNATGKTKLDDKSLDEERKRKIDAISQDHDSTRFPNREIFQSSESSPQPVFRASDNGKLKKKSKGKDKKSVEKESDGKKVDNLNDDQDQDGKAKKDVPNVNVEHEKLANDKNDVDHSVHESSRKLKKKKKKTRQNDETLQEPTEVTMKDSPEEKQSTEMDEGQGRKDTQNIDENPVIEQPPNDVMPDVETEPNESAVNKEDDAKKKRKKKKSKKIEKDSNPGQGPMETPKSEEKTKLVEEQTDSKRALKPREFSNGLIIEDLSMGKPDGKRALPGSKVSVHYIGKIQKDGKIFDSNIGGKPFSFRMGIGEVIKGWDVGVNGMRVGDKRRLTIPPSMGYGVKNVGKIPGNSWLVFDVELVNVK